MNQCLIDTNALLRFLLNDNQVQAQQVKEVFHKAKTSLIKVTIPTVVVVEVVYVLTKFYGFGRTDVSEKLLYLLDNPYIYFDKHDFIKSTLIQWKNQSNLSFVDILVIEEALATGSDIVTFDQKMLNYIQERGN